MKEELKKILKNSQSTYFHYPVAAILECQDGTKFYGVNVETASPAAGICAERNALFSALTYGYTKNDFKAIHLMASSDKELYPCFICRQALIEYCSLDMPVMIYAKDEVKTTTVNDLAPYRFSGDDLK